MRFLFVERKVLHEAVNALAGASADFRRRHFAVEQSVFGKILEIATAEGASVDIDAGRYQPEYGRLLPFPSAPINPSAPIISPMSSISS